MITYADKALAVLLWAGANWVRNKYGWDFGLGKEDADAVAMFLTAVIVYYTPNKAAA